MSYTIGSKVVHPCYGAGTVVRIQDKSIGETSHSYYIIVTVSRGMQLMVPVSRAEDVRLRSVGDPLLLRDTLGVCAERPPAEQLERDLRARQAEMRDQLKSGVFLQVAEVARTLFFLNARRPLGTIDRQLFEQGKELLAGELALATGIAIVEAMQEVESSLNRMLETVS